jgi:nitrogen-specific signal transduction histidine kinase/ActR/RegA family two-component response regulator
MAPLRDSSGNIVGVTSAGLDITHQRRLENELRQAQKMEAIGRLAGGIAHDFNNILTVVVGYGEMLLGEVDVQSQVGQRVQAMHEGARRAAELTNELLTFSRRQVVTGEPADLNAVVAAMRPILERIIGEHIELRFGVGDDPLCVAADRSQLEQLLLNLIVNARDAMPGGGALTITTASAAALSGPTTAVLRVTDTGVGIDEDARDRIFEPFFTTKVEGEGDGGIGLGLSTVYGIVAQHGGDLDVSSVPGAGTVFTVSLPLLSSRPPPGSATDRRSGPGAVVARPATVLLVEDEASVRLLTREILEVHGHLVIEAADGAAALSSAAAHAGPIDVLLTDVVLPQMVGPVLADRLLTERPGLQVVFMSGYAREHLAGVDLRDGAQFLPKPFRPADLAAAVAAALAAAPAPTPGG